MWILHSLYISVHIYTNPYVFQPVYMFHSIYLSFYIFIPLCGYYTLFVFHSLYIAHSIYIRFYVYLILYIFYPIYILPYEYCDGVRAKPKSKQICLVCIDNNSRHVLLQMREEKEVKACKWASRDLVMILLFSAVKMLIQD